MADVEISCLANDAAENISAYHFFKDDAEIGVSPTPVLNDVNVVPGIHKYEVAAENVWGLGPKSDPAYTPVSASKVTGVSVRIVLNLA